MEMIDSGWPRIQNVSNQYSGLKAIASAAAVADFSEDYDIVAYGDFDFRAFGDR
jgi:hypothetical protein